MISKHHVHRLHMVAADIRCFDSTAGGKAAHAGPSRRAACRRRRSAPNTKSGSKPNLNLICKGQVSTCRSFSVRRLSPASRRARAAATPGGITGGRATPSRGAGIATCIRCATSCIRLPCSDTGYCRYPLFCQRHVLAFQASEMHCLQCCPTADCLRITAMAALGSL